MTDFPLEPVLARLAREVKQYKVPVVDLIAVQSRDPYKVLVATILSARTKDETTAAAAARLFARAPDLAGLAALSEDELTSLIHPVGFFRNKAGYLARLPQAIKEKFNGRIPDSVEELVQLPGVGRKTANLVVAVAFAKPAICVDTHVHRIMNIWGYVKTATPLATEMALRQKLPPRHWLTINSTLVAFGQAVCKPLYPHCDRCPVAQWCPQLGVKPRRVKTGWRQSLDHEAALTSPDGGESTGKTPAAASLNLGKPSTGQIGNPGEPANKPGEVGGSALSLPLRLISWNVNGLRAVAGKGFHEAVAQLDPDILALQEIKAHPEQLPPEVRELTGYQAWWLPARRKGYSGVAVYSRLKPLAVTYGMEREEFDQEGRVLTLEFADFFLVNAYLPNAQPELARLEYKLAFCRRFNEFTAELARQKTVVVCGDLNVAHREIDLARPKDNQGSPGFSPPERAWMDSFLAAGFIDSFRLLHPDEGDHYSWWSYRGGARQRNVGWRIDYFCIDRASRRRIAGAAIHPQITGSDHCPVELELLAK